MEADEETDARLRWGRLRSAEMVEGCVFVDRWYAVRRTLTAMMSAWELDGAGTCPESKRCVATS